MTAEEKMARKRAEYHATFALVWEKDKLRPVLMGPCFMKKMSWNALERFFNKHVSVHTGIFPFCHCLGVQNDGALAPAASLYALSVKAIPKFFREIAEPNREPAIVLRAMRDVIKNPVPRAQGM
jgi:hypothetical protein